MAGNTKGRRGERAIVIDISHLSTGFYFIKLSSEKGIFVEKIIKN